MCNPFQKSNLLEVSTCNKTGLWKIKDKDIENACLNDGMIEATHPYRNIYCYICNTQESTIIRNKELYSVHMSRGGIISYYLYPDDALDLGYEPVSANRISSLSSSKILCKKRYKKWKYNIDCKLPLPFSVLSFSISNLLSLGDEFQCNLTKNIQRNFTLQKT